MNPFQRARNEAYATREKLVPGRANEVITAKELLIAVESNLGLAIEAVNPEYPDLGHGTAVLQREQLFIYVSNQISAWGEEFCALVAHELGHWFLDAAKPLLTIADLKNIYQSEGSPAVMKVEAYGARERQELQANVFARELLLPRRVAKSLIKLGSSPRVLSKQLGIPLEFVRLQMLDAHLLPDSEESINKLHPPSKDQLAAAKAEERAANVVAGPGTGKSSTLIHRVKYLVEEKNVDPSQILVLTFTNKAAFELVERLRGAGLVNAADVWAGTFHAFGLEFLRKFHQQFNLDENPQVADRLKILTMLVGGLPQLNLNFFLRVEDPFEWLSPIIEAIKRMKEELVTPEDYRIFVKNYPDTDPELQRQREDVATIYEAHEKLLGEYKVVDFVDLVAKPALRLLENRTPFHELCDKFQYILVDEYQDVTHAMVELLRQLAKNSKSIWVVGDIRQAIHHWRGASLKSLLKFDIEFKAHAGGTKIQRYPLDTNRRSYQEILDLVEMVGRIHTLESRLPLDKMSSEKGYCGEMPTVVTCSKRNEILSSVVDNILALQKKGVNFGQQSVLCRNGNDVQQAAEILASRGIPVIYIGELAQRAEIKQLLCLMQLLVERQPRALIGLAFVPGLNMPLKDINHLIEASNNNVSYQRGRWIRNPPSGLSAIALVVIDKLRSLLGNHSINSSPWSFISDMLLEHQFGLPEITDNSVSSWVKRIALWQFAYAVRNGDGETKTSKLARFLIRQRLRQRIGESYVDRELPPEANSLDGVRILTVHGSKGLEFDATHVAFVNSGSYGAQYQNWQSPNSLLEIVPPEALGSNQAEYADESATERNNLLYVALSRARRHLYIYQDNEFGEDNLAPQLQHYPQKYKSINYSGPANFVNKNVSSKSFKPTDTINFENFSSYTICPLQYWYSQELGLKIETDIDISVRARWAVMSALKEIGSVSGGVADAESRFHLAWNLQKLPLEAEDPSLWRDAVISFSRGLELVSLLMKQGGKFAEPITVVAGINIKLPWGFVINRQYSTEFAMVRFSRRRVQDISTILKPMIPGLLLTGTKKLTLNYILSTKIDDVPGGKRLESTKSFKAAVRMLNGENQPSKGKHCGRCAYMTICPSAPSL